MHNMETKQQPEIIVEHVIPNGVKLRLGDAFLLMRRTPRGWVNSAFKGNCNKQSELWMYFIKHIKDGSTPIA